MSPDRSPVMERHSEVVSITPNKGQDKPSPQNLTAQMLSAAIVELYRLSGWPPWRVAAEIAVGSGSREDVLRWARDGVPREKRHLVWNRVEDLRQRWKPARHWGPRRVRRLREEVGSRLDLALEVGVELETVRAWESGERRPTRSEATDLKGLERQCESADHRRLMEGDSE